MSIALRRGQRRASPAGGKGGAAPPDSGPGALLRYSAGGAGQPGTPGHAAWRKVLGLGWSHDSAQRIVEDPVAGDETEVWLITRHGTFRHFSDLEAGLGLRAYGAVAPSDEERTLWFDTTSAGWELHELDGTVHRFDSAGRWSSTIDRNGNAKTATYDGTGRLTEVAMPDGRREFFTYQASGKLAMIREVGVGADCVAQPQSCRTWSYTWSGDVLRQIDRPDGTARLVVRLHRLRSGGAADRGRRHRPARRRGAADLRP